jgi:hypothetical protein
MCDDILTRLNEEIRAEVWGLLVDARTEIERLRAAATAERVLADQLAKALRIVKADRPSAHTDEVWSVMSNALNTYKKARRG